MLKDTLYTFFLKGKCEEIIIFKIMTRKGKKPTKTKHGGNFQINLRSETQALESYVQNALVKIGRHKEDNNYDQSPKMSYTKESLVR